jgi:hypothetical protein
VGSLQLLPDGLNEPVVITAALGVGEWAAARRYRAHQCSYLSRSFGFLLRGGARSSIT